MGAKRHHAPLSRADLLWCLGVSTTDQYTNIAKLLGFEDIGLPADEETVPDKDVQKDVATFRERPNLFFPLRPNPVAIGASFYRLKDWQLGHTTPDSTKDARALPDWYTQAKPTFLQETATKVPVIHRAPPEFPPLVSWARLWPFLQYCLGANVPSNKPDIQKLVWRVSQGELVRRIPKHTRYTWSPTACLLIDINEDNLPYRQDFLRLKQQLAAWRGDDGLDIQFIRDEPGGTIAHYQNGQETLQAWQPPRGDTPLLILSDMGMQARSRRSLYQWILFGQSLSLQGIRPTVLMPVAARDIDSRLLQYFTCIIWDGGSRLRPVRGNAQTEQDQQPQMAGIRHLLALLFPALRVDLGLLRVARHLLPANKHDVGHESAIWHHSAVNIVGDEWGWQANSRGQYLKEFTEQFQQLSSDNQQIFIEQLGRHHAQLPDELYFEAMDELIRLKLPVPEEVKVATHNFMSTLVRTYAEYPEHQGLDLWVKRYLARHDHPDMQGVSEHQSALLAFKTERTHKENATSVEWPIGIPAEQILPFINHRQEQQAYLLQQTGQQLALVPITSSFGTSSNDWEQAVTLLKLTLTDTKIFHRYTATDGSEKQVSLNLEKGKQARIFFQPGTNHRLQVGAEIFQLEILSAAAKEDWIEYRGMEGETTWVETRDNRDKLHRWYWHPPEAGQHQVQAERYAMQKHTSEPELQTFSYPGFWHYLPPDAPSLTPRWATHAGRDTYGFYADLNIAGVIQRFRWIQPGSFLMGSPPEEEGRYDDETQHRVILTQGYWLADTACTNDLWRAINERSRIKTAMDMNAPVTNLSWDEITQSLRQFNRQHPELALRIPTEAEWEYACRAGTTTAFHFGRELSRDRVNYSGILDTLAIGGIAGGASLVGAAIGGAAIGGAGLAGAAIAGAAIAAIGGRLGFGRSGISGSGISGSGISGSGISGSGISGSGISAVVLDKPIKVKSYPPNQWGLYEMNGNVYEWCQDWFGDYPVGSVVDPQGAGSGVVRVLRGGSLVDNGRRCRSACRDRNDPSLGHDYCGFRLALGFELQSGKSRTGQRPV